MHEISVSVVSPEAAEDGVAELWTVGAACRRMSREDR